MSYKSPIDIIYGNIETKLEGDVVKAIQSYNINVDKDELIKALNYDREQYKAGYTEALETITNRIIYNMRNLEPRDIKEIFVYNHILIEIETIKERL